MSVHTVCAGLDTVESVPLGLELRLLRSNNWAFLRPKPATPVRGRLGE